MSGDYNNRLRNYNTFGAGTIKMKGTHRVTVKIADKMLPKNRGVYSWLQKGVNLNQYKAKVKISGGVRKWVRVD